MNDESKSKTRTIKKMAFYGLIVNVLLFASKLIFGLAAKSQALIADAIHSITDTTTDIAIVIGVKYWSAPADKNHPHGHRRFETILTLAIGLTIALTAVGISYRGITSITSGQSDRPAIIALPVAIIAIITKEILFRCTILTGRKIRSSALVANAWHHRSDALSSIPVAIAILLAQITPSLSIADSLGAMAVSLFIFHAAWKLTWTALKELADTGAPIEVIREIKYLTETIDGVLEAHDIRTRSIGSNLQLDMHIIVDGKISVNDGHEISEKVKRKLHEKFSHIVDLLIHVDPDNLEEYEKTPK